MESAPKSREMDAIDSSLGFWLQFKLAQPCPYNEHRNTVTQTLNFKELKVQLIFIEFH